MAKMKSEPTDVAIRDGAPPSGDDTAAAAGSQTRPPAAPTAPTPPPAARRKLGERPAAFRSTAQEVGFVAQATVATATTSFLTGAAVVVTASIGRDLGMTQGEISWITASTSLTAGAFQLGLGQLADLLGRKMLFVAGMAAYGGLALLVGFAQNPFWMDVVSGLLGVCAAMVVPPAIGILGASYAVPSKRKNWAFSAFSAGNPLGFVFGSILCGVAARLFDWRATYFLIAILWIALAALAVWTVPRVETYDPRQPVRARLRHFARTFDFVGTVLTIFGTGVFSAGITLGPADGWRSAHVIAMLVVGVALIVLFVFWERTFANPLMPPHMWKDRNFTGLMIVVLLGMSSFSSSSFWLPLFMQELQGLNPLTVALHLLPQAIAGMLWNLVAGSILHRINNTLIMAFGCVAYVVSHILLSLMKRDSSYWSFTFPALIVCVIGADFQFNVANMYVMQSLPSHQQSLAGGIFNTLIRLSTVVALGLSTAVFTSVAATPRGMADPMLPYTRAFQVSIGLSGASILFLPLIRLGTQGNAPAADAAAPPSVEELRVVEGKKDAPATDARAASDLEWAGDSKR